MPTPDQLLARLDAIGRSLQQSEAALALLGLGSVGLETNRLDAYSDLDFFVIVKPGWKVHYIDSLNWLSTVAPLAYTFRNTNDGYTVLFADGIYAEFAIFEPDELEHIPLAQGRVIWQDPAFDPSLCIPHQQPGPKHATIEGTPDWHVGEALTNLYVGLARVLRGERLVGTRHIQSHAVDHVLALVPHWDPAASDDADLFNQDRRFERRFPQTARILPTFIQGYEHNQESALAILAFLEQHAGVNGAISAAIRDLCARL